LSEIRTLKAKVKVKERLEVKEKTEAHPENKVTVASGAAKVLAVEKAPALTNTIPRSALVRLKEKEKGKAKREEETHRPLALVDALIHRTGTLRHNFVNAFYMKKAPAQKVHPNVRMHILPHVDSFLKVNAETENTAKNAHFKPKHANAGTDSCDDSGGTGDEREGKPSGKAKAKAKRKGKAHTLRRLFLE